MFPYMINNRDIKLYAHNPSNYKLYIFPIHGLTIKDNTIINIGNVEFLSKEHLTNSLNNIGFVSNIINEMRDTQTFAVVDLEKYGDIEGICSDGNNSLALQIVKQAIGGIYIAIYKNNNSKLDYEKRIIISTNNRHEVDDGLVSYFECNANDKQIQIRRNVSPDYLCIAIDQVYLASIKDIQDLFTIKIKDRSKYQLKLLKSLELLYATYNKIYTNERIFKFAMIVNHIFHNSLVSAKQYNSKYIGGKIRILFDIILKKKSELRKVAFIFNDIYERLRNNPLHGELMPYEEVCLINYTDYIPLKKIVMETLIILIEDNNMNKLKNTEEVISYLESKQNEVKKH